jgi:ankyrin repeat domain-containing protein 50
MDGLSAAASVIAVIQMSVQVFNLCNDYFLAVKDARKDIKLLSDEVSSLHDVLENIAEMADSPSAAKLSTLDLLTKPDGPMELCQTELEMLKAKLDTGHGEGKMKRFGLRAWKWPFTSKDVKATLVIIGRQRDLLNLASTADTMYVSPIEFLYVLSDLFRGLSLAIDQGVTQLRHDIAAARIDKDRDKIISWISNTDPSTNYLAACKKRQLTTGEWFLKGASMDEWKTTKNSLLWLHGIR